MHKILLSPAAQTTLEELEQDHSLRIVYKAVNKILMFMAENLHHPSLHTHEYHGITGPAGEKIFEAYAQQHTPGAYRIFWYYGPGANEITIISIVHHP